jgi:methionyl-tRNA formyltransferase
MEAIYAAGGKLDLALTLEDGQAVNKSGRVWIDQFCTARDVELVKTRHINNADALAAIAAARLDWLFIVGWSQIASAEVLAAPRRGVLGMHPTLLPVGRGRAAVPWAILHGLRETGVTLFRMDEGVDTGDIIGQCVIPLHEAITATELYSAVETAHVTLTRTAFPKLLAGTVEPYPQDERRATLWPGRKPEDGEIDLSGSVRDAERLVRAVTRPYPGAFVREGGRKIIVWQARIVATAEGAGPIWQFCDGLLQGVEVEDNGPA